MYVFRYRNLYLQHGELTISILQNAAGKQSSGALMVGRGLIIMNRELLWNSSMELLLVPP